MILQPGCDYMAARAGVPQIADYFLHGTKSAESGQTATSRDLSEHLVGATQQ
jgi:hypothetical protein